MRFFTTIYLVLLAYIVVALVFWELSLQRQSGNIYAQELITLKSQIDSAAFPGEYSRQQAMLEDNLRKRTYQYIGEGSTFLILILIGASIVFTSFRRRIKLSRQQNNFMLSVTHELKSPIAAMKLNLQTLEKHRLDEDNRLKLIERCIKEANRLNDLCNNVLFTSQIDSRQYRHTSEPINLSEMLERVTEQYAQRYPQRFEEDIQPGCRIKGDAVMLQIAINNLLENAVKYTPPDKPITVQLTNEQQNVVIRIIDEGEGIAESEKKKIFEKFYRVGNEESRATKGTGLGLYLVSKIIIQHKGRITVKDNAPSGAIFEIVLPLSA